MTVANLCVKIGSNICNIDNIHTKYEGKTDKEFFIIKNVFDFRNFENKLYLNTLLQTQPMYITMFTQVGLMKAIRKIIHQCKVDFSNIFRLTSLKYWVIAQTSNWANISDNFELVIKITCREFE